MSFDFSQEVATSDSIVTAVTTVTVDNGTDSTPSAMIVDAATVSGKTVMQKVVGGLNGVVYKLRCKATDSAGGVHVIVGRLQVQRL